LHRMEIPSIFLWVLFALLGACFGSFFNVLIYRMPRNISIVRPASHCPICKHNIPLWQNIPVLSWLFLKGRCANCKEAIPIKYPIVEFLGLLLGFVSAFITEPDYAKNANLIEGIALFWLTVTLIPIFAIDFKYLLLPDTVTIGGIIVGIALSFFEGGIGWESSLIGFASCGGGLYLFSVISAKIIKKEGMGLGDVKLFAGFGAIMGAEPAFITLIAGSAIAIITIVPTRIFTKENMSAPLPFGPFLGLAAPIVLTIYL